MKTRILTILLSLCILTGNLSFLTDVYAEEYTYASWTEAGNDAEETVDYMLIEDYDSYITNLHIMTAKGLAYAANFIKSYNDQEIPGISLNIILDNDIDLNSVSVQDKNWNPIGTSPDDMCRFGMDGQDHTITGLYIDRPEADYQGLFGYVPGDENFTIQNLTIRDSEVTGRSYVGAIAGYAKVQIENCRNYAAISGVSYIGGIVGSADIAIYNCENTGNIKASESFAGGIAASENNRIIYVYNSCNSGNVTAAGICAGGIIAGYGAENCYNTGNVSAGNYTGGIVAQEWGGSASNCYNSGTVTAAGDETVGIRRGAIIASAYSTNATENCFYVREENDDLLGVGSTKSDAKGFVSAVTYEELKNNTFVSVLNEWVKKQKNKKYLFWKQEESLNNGYPIFTPYLYNTVAEALSTVQEGIDYENDANGDLLIKTAVGMLYFAKTFSDGTDYTGKTVKLAANIDMELAAVKEASWNQLGTNKQPWTGTFDGQQHTISNIVTPHDGNSGLFYAIAENGSVQNVTLAETNLLATGMASAIAFINKGTIQKCVIDYSVTINGGQSAAGIATVNDGQITDCRVMAQSISTDGSSGNVGGIAAMNNGIIRGCTVTGNDGSFGNTIFIRSENNTAGGIAAVNSGTINECINEANITGSTGGGIAGENSGSIKNCFNGDTTYNGRGCILGYNDAGGIAGHHTGTIVNCGAVNTYSGGSKTTMVSGGNAGGIAGYSSGSIKNCYNASSSTGAALVGYWDEIAESSDTSIEHCYFLGGSYGYNAVAYWNNNQGYPPGDGCAQNENMIKTYLGAQRSITGINDLNAWVQKQQRSDLNLWKAEKRSGQTYYPLPTIPWSAEAVIDAPKLTNQTQRDETHEKASFTIKGTPNADVEIATTEKTDKYKLTFNNAQTIKLNETGEYEYEAEPGYIYFVRYPEQSEKVTLITESEYFTKLYTVRFLDDNAVLTTKMFPESSHIGTSPITPEKEGYTFLFWTNNKETKKTYSLDTGYVSPDLELYAVWKRKFSFDDFELTFYGNEEKQVDLRQQVSYLDKTATFSKEHMEFEAATLPSGFTLDKATGIITVAPGTEPNDYVFNIKATDQKPFVTSGTDENPVGRETHFMYPTDTITAKCTIHIKKMLPEYQPPAPITAKKGQTLSELPLPSGFSWQEEQTELNTLGEHMFYVTFTPNDTARYEIVENIPVTVFVKAETAELTITEAYTDLMKITASKQEAGIELKFEALDTSGAERNITVYQALYQNDTLQSVHILHPVADASGLYRTVMIDGDQEERLFIWDESYSPITYSIKIGEIRNMLQ